MMGLSPSKFPPASEQWIYFLYAIETFYFGIFQNIYHLTKVKVTFDLFFQCYPHLYLYSMLNSNLKFRFSREILEINPLKSLSIHYCQKSWNPKMGQTFQGRGSMTFPLLLKLYWLFQLLRVSFVILEFIIRISEFDRFILSMNFILEINPIYTLPLPYQNLSSLYG